jgi:hypothetical protein
MHGLMPFSYKTQIIAILGSFIFITAWNLQISLFGSSYGEIILLSLTSSKTIPWLKTNISISNKIFNLLLQKGSFLPFSFSVQNFLFHGYVHDFMITTSKMDTQSLSVNSKSKMVGFLCGWIQKFQNCYGMVTKESISSCHWSSSIIQIPSPQGSNCSFPCFSNN